MFLNNQKRQKGQTKKKAEKTKKDNKNKDNKKTKKYRKKTKKEKKNQGPAHLDLNPPHFSSVVLFPFLSLLPIDKKPSFSPRKGHFMFLFACLPFLSLSLFWPPPFFTFSFSVSLFLSFFLPSCLSFLFHLASWFCCLFVCLSFLLCFCFMIRTTSKYSITKFFLHQYFLHFGFLSCLLFEILLSYLCFPDFKLCFCSNIKWLIADQRKA